MSTITWSCKRRFLQWDKENRTSGRQFRTARTGKQWPASARSVTDLRSACSLERRRCPIDPIRSSEGATGADRKLSGSFALVRQEGRDALDDQIGVLGLVRAMGRVRDARVITKAVYGLGRASNRTRATPTKARSDAEARSRRLAQARTLGLSRLFCCCARWSVTLPEFNRDERVLTV